MTTNAMPPASGHDYDVDVVVLVCTSCCDDDSFELDVPEVDPEDGLMYVHVLADHDVDCHYCNS